MAWETEAREHEGAAAEAAARRIGRVLVVGGGKMGGAILAGWLAAATGPAAHLDAGAFAVADPGEERRRYLEETYGVRCAASAAELADPGDPAAFAPDLVLLSVKPQVMSAVLEGLPQLPGDPLYVSIAAGLPCERLAAGLPAGARLVRVMPNMPLLVGQGAAGVCGAAGTPAADVQLVADLFACMGAAEVVDEAVMDAVCALSGSGPGYVAALVEVLRDAACAEGLDAGVAERLAVQTVLGTARLIAQTGQTPEEVRRSICSPGGTTLAGLAAMEAAGFSQAVAAGVAAAAARSKELSQC